MYQSADRAAGLRKDDANAIKNFQGLLPFSHLAAAPPLTY